MQTKSKGKDKANVVCTLSQERSTKSNAIENISDIFAQIFHHFSKLGNEANFLIEELQNTITHVGIGTKAIFKFVRNENIIRTV